MRLSAFTTVSTLALLVGTAGTQLTAQDIPTTYSIYGTPGLLEMPSAATPPEGAIATTISYREGLFQTVFNYQITDRLSGSFRYALVDLYDDPDSTISEREFERGFDLQFTLLKESSFAPEIAIGLRDFLTPGRLQSEYVVATKGIGDNLTVTAGLGWGAMATRDGFDNPISGRATRPVFDESTPEGQLASDYWFAGDAAVFGGLEYQINDRWGVLAEYSSIAYPQSPYAPAVAAEEPYSIGVTYRPDPSIQLSFAALNGSELAVSGTFYLNANNRPAMSGLEGAPAPVNARSVAERQQLTWDRTALPEATLRRALAQAFRAEGLSLVSLQLTDDTARIRFTNNTYRAGAQALGRAARMMTQVMPASIDIFILEQEKRGLPLSAVTIARNDLEDLENRSGAAAAIFARSEFDGAGPDAGLVRVNAFKPSFSWGLNPFFRINPFGNNGGVSVDGGLRLNASYRFAPDLVLSGAIVQSLFRNDAKDPGVDSTPELQNVRSDGQFYGDDSIPVLQSLTLNHFGRPADDLYSRVTVGYLERMFGGVSTEVLWKPADSRLGLGAELNYVAQRNTDMFFGFDEYDYTVATGHLSAYYDLGGGYHTQLDVGRYLAGDWGATVHLAREYANGVRIAGYITQTEVSYEDFGNGSYNKGVSISIPTDFLTGETTRGTYGTDLRTPSGDGGARLNVSGRLYDLVREAHQSDLADSWGRFWR